jgi:hypothetical protein
MNPAPAAGGNALALRKKITFWLWVFIVGLILSGLTAFPLETEVYYGRLIVGQGTVIGGLWPELAQWIEYVYRGLVDINQKYPFMPYGTDWLAFAHLVIAIAFIGPLRDPVKNIWVVEFGMIACALIVPLAFICGPIRGIPFFWQLFDCAFGAFGIIPLWLARRAIVELSMAQRHSALA